MGNDREMTQGDWKKHSDAAWRAQAYETARRAFRAGDWETARKWWEVSKCNDAAARGLKENGKP